MTTARSERWSQPDGWGFVAACGSAALFLVAWGLVHRWFWAHGQLVDTPTYQAYGEAMRHGLVPYRDFAVEYPPGALPAFVAPTLLGASYAAAFAWTMAACGVAAVLVVSAVSWRAAAYVALLPVLVGSLVLSRFDLWPALLAVGALAALWAGRDRLGWAVLALAIAAKVWPAALVPLALAWTWRRRGRREVTVCAAALAVVLVVVFVPFLVLAPHGVWESVRGQADRPLQLESLGSALLIVVGDARGVITSHGSQNLTGPHAGTAATILPLLQAAALVGLWWAFARVPRTREDLLRYAAACVCAFVAFDKVFSPQYLIWLVPFVPLVRGRRGLAAAGLLTAALVLTQVWFPLRYWRFVGLDRGLAGVVLARDLVVVALLVLLAWPSAQASSTGTRTSRQSVARPSAP
jgi:uncharacterized membrane protein